MKGSLIEYKKQVFCVTLILLGLIMYIPLHAQSEAGSTLIDAFSGSVEITNNGISFVPTFSLGAPASILHVRLAKNRFSFEPEMRFALEGKPWSFLFWFRYKAIQRSKFNLRLGAHPALNFRTVTAVIQGESRELIESRRYLATEIVPSYKLSKKVQVGMYYLYARGFDDGLQNGHFLLANLAVNQISLSKEKKLYANIVPQIYYLNMDKADGFYTATFFTFGKQEFPFTLHSIVNIKLNSDIPSDPFVWNVTLRYSFR